MVSTEVLRASVTPLASIFGSGFLIIVPLLERSIGGYAVLGVVAICATAWLVGTAIRHNIRAVEGPEVDGTLDRGTIRLERLSDVVIAIAYIVSVALYLRIMAEYTVRFVSPGAEQAVALVAAISMASIVAVGVTRGFGGLDLLERVAVIAVLMLTTVLGVAFLGADLERAVGGDLILPPADGHGLVETLLLLGGLVITVQGFETVRYLREEYAAETRIRASRLAQAVAASIYVGFVVVATPLMGVGTAAGPDATLVDITERVVPLVTVFLVLCAVLSQFSAAIADTVAAAGNLHERSRGLARGRRAYLLCGAAAIPMIYAIPTFTLVAIASRAFAAYYFVQCLVAIRTSRSAPRKLAFGLLAALMAAITLLAQPVG